MKRKAINLALGLSLLLGLCLPAAAVTAPSNSAVPLSAQEIQSLRTTETPRDLYEYEYQGLHYVVVEGMAHVVGFSETLSGKVVIPEKAPYAPVVAIDTEAFLGNETITEVVLPDTVKFIGSCAFCGCSALKKVNLPAGLCFLGSSAFDDTPFQASNPSKNGLTYIDRWLINVDAEYSGHLRVQDGTVGIAECAASFCSDITRVTLPIGLKYVCSSAFEWCESLVKVVFMGNAPFIPELDTFFSSVFGCDELTAYYPMDNATWNSSVLLPYDGEVTWVPVPFVDLLDEQWYDPFCSRAAQLGLMNGMGNNLFEPNVLTNRAMFVQALYSTADYPRPTISNPFTDIPANEWFTRAVLWAFENGVTAGTSPTTFEPFANVTREQIATFLYSYCGKPAVKGDLSGFEDVDQVDFWAVTPMIWATQNGLITGSLDNGKLYLLPTDPATRAQTAAITTAFYDRVDTLLPVG